MVAQDLCSGKEWRKLSTVWKLLVLVVIGGSGVYMCMVGVGLSPTRHFPYEPSDEMVVSDWRREDSSCSGHASSSSSFSSASASAVDFYQHFPLPHTYHRFV